MELSTLHATVSLNLYDKVPYQVTNLNLSVYTLIIPGVSRRIYSVMYIDYVGKAVYVVLYECRRKDKLQEIVSVQLNVCTRYNDVKKKLSNIAAIYVSSRPAYRKW